jgi:ribosome recycling factor
MSIVLDDTKKSMQAAIEHLLDQFKSLRTNRVNPGMLDDIKVEAYGSQMALKGVATITVQERNLVITPFDPTMSDAIVKAINTAHMNLNALKDQGVIRVPVPPLDENMRKDIAKQAKKKSEDAKIVVREVRRKSNESVKKDAIGDDEKKGLEKKVQGLTDDYCKKIDDLFNTKEKDILTI